MRFVLMSLMLLLVATPAAAIPIRYELTYRSADGHHYDIVAGFESDAGVEAGFTTTHPGRWMTVDGYWGHARFTDVQASIIRGPVDGETGFSEQWWILQGLRDDGLRATAFMLFWAPPIFTEGLLSEPPRDLALQTEFNISGAGGIDDIANIATVRLVRTPEPSTLALVLLGLVGALAAIRRRRPLVLVEGPAPFMLPWVRVELLIQTIRATIWDERTGPVVKAALLRALALRQQVRREGWWN